MKPAGLFVKKGNIMYYGMEKKWFLDLLILLYDLMFICRRVKNWIVNNSDFEIQQLKDFIAMLDYFPINF